MARTIMSFDCRGKARRDEIVENYDLKVISHTKLLDGQEKYSCAKMLLTDKYYTFSYTNKSDSNDTGTFICGSTVGNELINKANINSVPLFNPLKATTNGNGVVQPANNGLNNNNVHTPQQRGELEEELYTAINLIVLCWNTPIHGLLATIQEKLIRYNTVFSIERDIKTVNNILGKDYKKRTLIQMVGELQQKHPDLKSYSFPKINEYLKSISKISNFG